MTNTIIFLILLVLLLAVIYFRYEQQQINKDIYDELDNSFIIQIKGEDDNEM